MICLYCIFFIPTVLFAVVLLTTLLTIRNILRLRPAVYVVCLKNAGIYHFALNFQIYLYHVDQ